MKEKGKVIAISASLAKISLEPSEACKNCPACNVCRPAGSVRIVEAENEIGAKIGDEVYIETSSKIGLIAIFLLFGMPVILGLIGLLIGMRYGEIYSIFCGIAGFALGLLCAKIINNILGGRRKFLPHIVETTSPHKS